METIAHCYAVSLFSLAKDENAVDSYQKDMPVSYTHLCSISLVGQHLSSILII